MLIVKLGFKSLVIRLVNNTFDNYGKNRRTQ